MWYAVNFTNAEEPVYLYALSDEEALERAHLLANSLKVELDRVFVSFMNKEDVPDSYVYDRAESN